MKITNKMGLPDPIVKSVSTEPHNNPGEYSATTLLRGNKEILLMDRHWDDLVDDCADRIWAIFGTAVHSVLEEQDTEAFQEEKVTHTMLDRVITGKMDLYDLGKKMIDDYKTGTVWKVIFNDFEDWRMQGLIYAWLLSVNDLPVKKVRFTALLKDWSKGKARTDHSYPQSPVHIYEYEITEDNLLEVEKYLYEKISSLKEDENKPDDEIPPCSEQQRWQKPSKFAIMKGINKRAVRLYDTREEAEKELMQKDSTHFIEERPSEPKKCMDYCLVRHLCHFGKELEV